MQEKEKLIEDVLKPHLQMFKEVSSEDKSHDWIVNNIIDDIKRIIALSPDTKELYTAKRAIETYDGNKGEVINTIENSLAHISYKNNKEHMKF